MNPNENKDLLNEIVIYDKDSGEFTWKARRLDFFSNESISKGWNKKYAGKRTGCKLTNSKGKDYIVIGVNNKSVYAHRAAWIVTFGDIPEGMEIDHINGDGTDNRILNLRLVTKRENNFNKRKPSNNTSGHNGVAWDKNRQKWMASIRIDRKNIFLGRYDEIDDAVRARENANVKYKFHANHGIDRPL